MSTTKKVELINKKMFAKLALYKNIKAFIIYVTSFNSNLILIYLAKKAQIILFFVKKNKNLAKYFDFLDVFSKKKTLMLPKLAKSN